MTIIKVEQGITFNVDISMVRGVKEIYRIVADELGLIFNTRIDSDEFVLENESGDIISTLDVKAYEELLVLWDFAKFRLHVNEMKWIWYLII